MKKYNIFKLILSIALVTVVFTSCQKLEVSAIEAPSDAYPTATISSDFVSGGTLSIGDTIRINILFNKPIKDPVSFDAVQIGGTAVRDVDYIVIPASVKPYYTDAELLVVVPYSWTSAEKKTLEIEVKATNLDSKYMLNPKSSNSDKFTINLSNYSGHIEVYDLTSEMAKDGVVKIEFDGPVTYVSGKKITLHDNYYSHVAPDQEILPEDIIIDGNTVEFKHKDFIEWTTMSLIIESGAFIDVIGNSHEEQIFEFSVAFNINSYAGDYKWSVDGDLAMDTIVTVIDEDNYILSVPDGNDIIDNLDVTIGTTDYNVHITDVRTGAYLIYYTPNGEYYVEGEAWYNDPDVAEASELLYRDSGDGHFDELTYEYGFTYSTFGDLVKGDGSKGTSGSLWDTAMAFSPDSGTSASASSAKQSLSNSKLRIVEEVILHGETAYRVEFVD